MNETDPPTIDWRTASDQVRARRARGQHGYRDRWVEMWDFLRDYPPSDLHAIRMDSLENARLLFHAVLSADEESTRHHQGVVRLNSYGIERNHRQRNEAHEGWLDAEAAAEVALALALYRVRLKAKRDSSLTTWAEVERQGYVVFLDAQAPNVWTDDHLKEIDAIRTILVDDKNDVVDQDDLFRQVARVVQRSPARVEGPKIRKALAGYVKSRGLEWPTRKRKWSTEVRTDWIAFADDVLGHLTSPDSLPEPEPQNLASVSSPAKV